MERGDRFSSDLGPRNWFVHCLALLIFKKMLKGSIAGVGKTYLRYLCDSSCCTHNLKKFLIVLL
jgi:hypothetical protein